MKILFTGLPYFGKQLVAELNNIDSKNQYVFCDTYYSKKDKIRFLWHLWSSKKVISFNGVTSKSRALNWALRFNKRIIMQWHGSDVLTAKANISSGVFTRKYVDCAKSFTDAVWLKTELKEFDIQTEILHFKHVLTTHDLSPFKTSNVLTYLAQGNESFYGLDHLLKLADDFTETDFHVVGSNGKSLEQKKNIVYHGWISENEFKTRLDECAVFMRFTSHDGYSLSVLRAIANGNYVIWNNPHSCVEYVENPENLSTQLKKLFAQISENNFSRNTASVDWAKTNLNKEKILKNYIETILK